MEIGRWSTKTKRTICINLYQRAVVGSNLSQFQHGFFYDHGFFYIIFCNKRGEYGKACEAIRFVRSGSRHVHETAFSLCPSRRTRGGPAAQPASPPISFAVVAREIVALFQPSQSRGHREPRPRLPKSTPSPFGANRPKKYRSEKSVCRAGRLSCDADQDSVHSCIAA